MILGADWTEDYIPSIMSRTWNWLVVAHYTGRRFCYDGRMVKILEVNKSNFLLLIEDGVTVRATVERFIGTFLDHQYKTHVPAVKGARIPQCENINQREGRR